MTNFARTHLPTRQKTASDHLRQISVAAAVAYAVTGVCS